MEQRDRAAARGRGQAHQRMSARGEAGRSARIPLSRHATRASDGIRRTSIASPSFASRMTCSTWMRALSHFLPRMRSATSRRSFFSRFLRLFSCRRRGCRSTRRCAWGRGARLAARAAESPRRRRCALVRLSFAREENAGAAPIEGPMLIISPALQRSNGSEEAQGPAPRRPAPRPQRGGKKLRFSLFSERTAPPKIEP